MRYRGQAKITFKSGNSQIFENVNLGEYDEAKKKFIIELSGYCRTYHGGQVKEVEILSFKEDTKEKPTKKLIEDLCSRIKAGNEKAELELREVALDYNPNYPYEDYIFHAIKDIKSGKKESFPTKGFLESLEFEYFDFYYPDDKDNPLDEQFKYATKHFAYTEKANDKEQTINTNEDLER